MMKIRVTSKHLGFMIALLSRFDAKYHRIPRKWWWIKPRYEMLISLDHEFQSADDYWTRFEIVNLAMKRRCYNFSMEAFSNVKYEQVC